MSPIQLTIVAIIVALAISSIMASAWYVQQRTGNSGWVDVTWSLGVGGVAIHRRGLASWIRLAALAADTGGGARRILVLATGCSHCGKEPCCSR